MVEKQIKESLKEKQPTLDVFKVMYYIYKCYFIVSLLLILLLIYI